MASAVCPLLALCLAGSVVGQDATVADKLAEALDFYNDLDYDAGLTIANGLMQRTDLTRQDSVAIYEVLSIITYAKGETYLQQSIAYLAKMSSIDPCIMPMPRDIWPQELRDRWYQFLQATATPRTLHPSLLCRSTISPPVSIRRNWGRSARVWRISSPLISARFRPLP
jgi:hypothetical protein